MISVRHTIPEDLDNLEIQESQRADVESAVNNWKDVSVSYTVESDRLLAIIFLIEETEDLASVGVRLTKMSLPEKRSVINLIHALMISAPYSYLYASARDDNYRSDRMLKYLGFKNTGATYEDDEGVPMKIFNRRIN